MPSINNKELLASGVHFGHLKKKWNPKMLPYIFMERKGIHIIDLNKTATSLERAGKAMRGIAKSGKKILFVATKKQAKDIVYTAANKINMPFVTERWLGGMLTNFATIRKSVKKMQSTERMLEDGSLSNVTKKERLMLTREKDKMQRVLGGIAPLNRIPAAIFIVDISHEHIALAEARKLGIKTFAMVDTNSDPTLVDFPIPANDDAAKSIDVITGYLSGCIKEGLDERRKDREANASSGANEESEGGETRKRARTAVKKKAEPVVETPKVETPAPVVEKVAAVVEAPAPVTKAPAVDAKPDDLTKVEGIGPAISRILVAAGINTFADLAGTDAAKVKELLTNAEGNFAFHDPTTWPKQADYAAKGEWDALTKWQDELDGGKLPEDAK